MLKLYITLFVLLSTLAPQAAYIAGDVFVATDVSGTNAVPTNTFNITSTNASLTGTLRADSGAFTNNLTVNGTAVSTFTGTAGTVVNTGTPSVGNVPIYSDVTGTNVAPSNAVILTGTNATFVGVITANGGIFTNALYAPSGAFSPEVLGVPSLVFSNVTRLVFDGDSLTSSNNPAAYPVFFTNIYFPTLSGVIVSNVAVSGQNAYDMLYNRYTNFVQPCKPAGTTNAILFAWGGANDVFYATNNADAIIAILSNYWSVAKADGFTVVAFTIPDRGNYTAGTATDMAQQTKSQVNAFIRNSSLWDYLVDVANKFPIANTRYYFSDSIHFTTNSARAIADLAFSAITKPKESPNTSGDVDPRYIGTNYFGRGTAAAPSISFSVEKGTGIAHPSTGFIGVTASGTGLAVWQSGFYRMNSGMTMGWTSGNSWSTASDTFFGRESAAVVQMGADAASPIAQKFKAHDGTGTDITGANFTLAGGQSTGTGRGGALIFQTSPSGATGSSVNSYSERAHYVAKAVTLTSAIATTVATIAVPIAKFVGGNCVVTVFASDATDHQARTLTFPFSAINKAGTVTAALGTPVEAIAVSAGTLTATITTVANGNAVDIKVDATSSLSETTLSATVAIPALNSNDTATVTEL
jgi:hypothetical protein